MIATFRYDKKGEKRHDELVGPEEEEFYLRHTHDFIRILFWKRKTF